MREFFKYVFTFNVRGLFVAPSDNLLIQAFRYAFVGVISFLVDWLCLYLLTVGGLHYLISAAFAYMIGLVVNFTLAKKFIFIRKPIHLNRQAEFIVYGLIGCVGLIITEALMFFFTDIMLLNFMISKVIAAVLAPFWNFTAKKTILYRKAITYDPTEEKGK